MLLILRLLARSLAISQPTKYLPHLKPHSLQTFHSVTMATEKPVFERLPTDVLPINYILSLEPNLTDFTFRGNVVIETKVSKPVTSVILNSCEIEVNSCSFEGNTGTLVGAIEYNKENETVRFTFQDPLPGDGKLSLEFTGILNDQMKGFYR